MKQQVPPFYTYVLRLWSKVEGTSSKVIIIRSESPLYPDQLKDRLEAVTHEPAKEFLYIEVSNDSSIVLSTWEEGIESHYPSLEKAGHRCFKNWWSAGSIQEVDDDGNEVLAT